MEEAREWMVFINGLLTLGVMGFIVRFSLMMKAAFLEREDVLQKRLDAFDEELKRTEKWAEREKNELRAQRDCLKRQLDSTLDDANVDPKSFDLLSVVNDISSEVKNKLKDISDKIERISVESLDINPEFSLSLAKAYASNGEWLKAAERYDLATSEISDNWELYFYKGVAYANSRDGRITNVKALQSYSDAIVYLTEDVPEDKKARLFIYKGAMLKRLKRVAEAENDVVMGLEFAKEDFEINDGLYNLSCIHAMKDDHLSFGETAKRLKSRDGEAYDYLLQRLNEFAPDFEVDRSNI